MCIYVHTYVYMHSYVDRYIYTHIYTLKHGTLQVACMNAPPKGSDGPQSTFARLRQQAASENEWFQKEVRWFRV